MCSALTLVIDDKSAAWTWIQVLKPPLLALPSAPQFLSSKCSFFASQRRQLRPESYSREVACRNLLMRVPRLRIRKRKCGRNCSAELPTVTRQFTLTAQHKHRPQGSSASESRLTSCGSRSHNLISYTFLCYMLLCLYHVRLSLITNTHTQVWAHTLSFSALLFSFVSS